MPKPTQAVCAVAPPGGPQVPVMAEMVLVVVEADAGGVFLAVVDRDRQLELQLLVALARLQHASGPAEERIVGDLQREGHFQQLDDLRRLLQPGLAEVDDLFAGVPMRTYSRWRNICMRSGSRDGSWRKQ